MKFIEFINTVPNQNNKYIKVGPNVFKKINHDAYPVNIQNTAIYVKDSSSGELVLYDPKNVLHEQKTVHINDLENKKIEFTNLNTPRFTTNKVNGVKVENVEMAITQQGAEPALIKFNSTRYNFFHELNEFNFMKGNLFFTFYKVLPDYRFNHIFNPWIMQNLPLQININIQECGGCVTIWKF
jgi:hypothetical protein